MKYILILSWNGNNTYIEVANIFAEYENFWLNVTYTLNGVATRKLLVSPKYVINTSKSAKKIRSVTCHYTPIAKYQSSSKSRGCRKKVPIYDYRWWTWIKLYASATLWLGIKRITMFSYTGNTEREMSGSNYNNRCANLIWCKTCIIIIYNNIIQN
jgi:hypothetical protein